MRIHLLPGNSKHNQSWIHAVSAALKHLYQERIAHEYAHWGQADGGSIDLPLELETLKSVNAFLEGDAIFGKSVGVILGLQAAHRRILAGSHGIFLGTPIKDAERAGINMGELIAGFPGRCLFIQQAKDPVESFWILRTFVMGLRQDADLVEVEGNDHNYENIGEIVKIIENWLEDKKLLVRTVKEVDH